MLRCQADLRPASRLLRLYLLSFLEYGVRPVGDPCSRFMRWRAEMPQGKIKRLVSDRGFGFIEGDRGDDLFFHHSSLVGVTIEELREGQELEYSVGRGPKGPCAESVRTVEQHA